MDTNQIRLYGRVLGYGSHAQVTRGFEEALEGAGLLTGVVSVDHEDAPGMPEPPGALAWGGIYTGPLGVAYRLTRAVRHEYRAAMVAPNSTAMPEHLMRALGELCTEILAPSEWAATVLRQYTALPVRTVPHGISAAFQVLPGAPTLQSASYHDDRFEVLHLSTSARARKGTRELLDAWQLLRERRSLPVDARLTLLLDPEAMSTHRVWLAERPALAGSVRILMRLNAPPEELAKLYSDYHVVCQPSRGEGFGLVPLEALACGVPVVATACTGHSEWAEPEVVPSKGLIRVRTEPLEPIDDLPNAFAPGLSPEAIATALLVTYVAWPQLSADAIRNAPSLQQKWSWSAQLAPYLAFLQKEGLHT